MDFGFHLFGGAEGKGFLGVDAAAVEDEYRETRDSMADVDPEQWSRINGMDPIRRIRTAE